MVVIDVVEIDWKTTHSLGDTLVPGRVVDSAIQVVHASWVWLFCVLSSEDRSVKQHVCDVVQLVVLYLHFICAA